MMRCKPAWLVVAVLGGLGLVQGPLAGQPAPMELSRLALAKRGKAATALVEVKAGRAAGYGSAFCVHASGLFLTNEHVVRSAPVSGQVALILNPSLKTEKVVKARIVRSDPARDLALLAVDGLQDLPTLPLGTDEELAELMEVVAFGFPFGNLLSPDKRDYPAVSVNAGSVTALRHKAGALERVQVDVVLNPGNSGGPVLDRQGRVIGVVVAGLPGKGINFVIPVGHVTAFLRRPEVEFHAPALPRAKLHLPADFEARAALLLPGTQPPQLDLVLRAGDDPERTIPMTRRGDRYFARAVPLPAAPAPVPVRATVAYPDGNVVGNLVAATADQAIRVAGKEHKLRDVARVFLKPAPRTELVDGTTASGPISGLDVLEVRVGKQLLKLTLAEALSVRLETVAPAVRVACTIVVRDGPKVLARVESAIAIREPVTPRPAIDDRAPAIGPAALTGDQMERRLPAPIQSIAVGGGGRYLALHLPKLRKIALFDVVRAEVVHYFPLAEDNVCFAAGLNKLLIALPGAGVIQRYDLNSFAREAVSAAPVKDEVRSLFMGSASAGPVLINGELCDLSTLKPLPIRYPGNRPLRIANNVRVRFAADGKTFGTWLTDMSPQGLRVFTLVGDDLKEHYAHDTVGHIRPAPDGSVIYTGRGVFTPECKPAGGEMPRDKTISIPAEHGAFFLTVPGPSPDLYLAGIARPLARLKQVTLWEGINHWAREVLPIDQRIHLVPDAKALVLIPPTNDRLVLYRVDPEDLLAKADVDYLFVASRPVTSARAGMLYEYPIVVRARRDGVKYKLESGPAEMRVSDAGRVTWNVPANMPAGDQNVLIGIRSASGQETFHSFRITVER